MAEPGGLVVAVSGPTGDIGGAVMRALERDPAVARIIAMGRRDFDPAAKGWTKATYLRGDVLDKDDVTRLVDGADVVVHLAFLIFGSDEDTRDVNVEGSRNVFQATVASGAQRLVYTSSVAAYGFHEENPDRLTEDVPARGTEDHPYSNQKAAIEAMLEDLTQSWAGDVYVFRPCIVAGPTALSLIEEIPYVRIGERIPASLRKVAAKLPLLRPVVPDPGVPFQLVHEDDVASAIATAVTGGGAPGVYNLAAEGDITVSDLARALGWYSVPLPDVAVDATLEIVSRFPLMPARAAWLNAVRVPVLMDCTKAHRELGWEPRYDVLDTLAETVHAARAKNLV